MEADEASVPIVPGAVKKCSPMDRQGSWSNKVVKQLLDDAPWEPILAFCADLVKGDAHFSELGAGLQDLRFACGGEWNDLPFHRQGGTASDGSLQEPLPAPHAPADVSAEAPPGAAAPAPELSSSPPADDPGEEEEEAPARGGPEAEEEAPARGGPEADPPSSASTSGGFSRGGKGKGKGEEGCESTDEEEGQAGGRVDAAGRLSFGPKTWQRDKNRRRTYLATVAYYGEGFEGWMKNPKLRTVQGVVEEALNNFVSTGVSGAGRTDKGVHATSQVVSFKTWEPLPEDFPAAMTGLLLPHARLWDAVRVPRSFHATFGALWRRYVYLLPATLAQSGGGAGREGPLEVDVGTLDALLGRLAGASRDYALFTRDVQAGKDTCCLLHRARAAPARLPRSRTRVIAIELVANRFLRKQIRVLVGTAVQHALCIQAGLRREQCPPSQRGPALHHFPAAGHGRPHLPVPVGSGPRQVPPHSRPRQEGEHSSKRLCLEAGSVDAASGGARTELDDRAPPDPSEIWEDDWSSVDVRSRDHLLELTKLDLNRADYNGMWKTAWPAPSHGLVFAGAGYPLSG